jgi:hypothetical protein
MRRTAGSALLDHKGNYEGTINLKNTEFIEQ